MPLALGFAQSRQRVGRLTRLRDGNDNSVAVDGWVAVAKLAGVLHLHRNPRKFLEQILAHERCMIAGPTRRQNDTFGAAELLSVEVESAEVGAGVGVVESAAEGV